jgi:hypothetical protein
MADIVWPSIQPKDLYGTVSYRRRCLMRRHVKRRSAQFGSFSTDQDLARSRFLLQLGGKVYGRAGNIETRDCIAAASAYTDQAGMNADTKSNRISSWSGRLAMALDIPSCNTGSIRMILKCARPTKDRDTTVARIVDDLSPSAFYRTTYMIQPLVQECLCVIRITRRNVPR